MVLSYGHQFPYVRRLMHEIRPCLQFKARQGLNFRLSEELFATTSIPQSRPVSPSRGDQLMIGQVRHATEDPSILSRSVYDLVKIQERTYLDLFHASILGRIEHAL